MPEISDISPTSEQMELLSLVDGKGAERHSRRKAYRAYYEGSHSTQLSERQRKYLSIKVGEEFNSNYCPTVVDALAEKLTVIGFKTSDEQRNLLWEWWQRARMDAVQNIVHLAAARDGDAYVIVGFDREMHIPTFTFEMAYDGNEGVEVRYGNSKRGQISFAFKKWQENTGYRVNLYFSDRIEKYFRKSITDGVAVIDKASYESWQPYMDAGDEAWPVPWVSKDGVPLGIPVIHFRNKDRGYNYGKSELHDVIPLQNALNKAIIDTVAAADTTGFRLYWMTGGDPEGLQIVPGSWVYSKDVNAKVGYFPGEDLSKLIEFKDAFAMEIARVSRTPISYFQMSRQLAGEGTLQQQEGGLLSRAKDRQKVFGNAWEDVMMIARKLWNAFADGIHLDEEEMLESLWADPETRNDKRYLEEMRLKHELGIPLDILWAEMGYSAEDIEDMKLSPEYQGRLRMMELGFGDENG